MSYEKHSIDVTVVSQLLQTGNYKGHIMDISKVFGWLAKITPAEDMARSIGKTIINCLAHVSDVEIQTGMVTSICTICRTVLH